MPTVGNVVVKVSAETAEFQRKLQQTKYTSNSFFKNLQNQYGRSSALGKSLKLLTGGGAILGIGLAAREFSKLGENVKALAAKVHEGGLSAAEMADEFTKSIPIVGDIYSGLKNIIGAVSGINGEIDDIATATKFTDAITAVMNSRGKAVKEFREEINKTLDDLDHRVQSLGMKGPAKDLFDSAHEYQQKTAEIQKQAAEKIANNREIQDLQKLLTDAKDKLRNMPQGASTISDLAGSTVMASYQMGAGGSAFLEQAIKEEDAKRKTEYAKQLAQVQSAEKQIADAKEKINAESNRAIAEVNADAAQEGAFHFKELIKEKLQEGVEAITPTLKVLAERQNSAVENALDQFFQFEQQANENFDQIQAKAKSLVAQTVSPYEEYLQTAQLLQQQFEGKQISQEQYAGALARMQEDLVGNEYRKTAATESRIGGKIATPDKSPADPMATLNNLQAKALEEQRKQSSYTVLTYNLLKGGTVPVVDIK